MFWDDGESIGEIVVSNYEEFLGLSIIELKNLRSLNELRFLNLKYFTYIYFINYISEYQTELEGKVGISTACKYWFIQPLGCIFDLDFNS